MAVPFTAQRAKLLFAPHRSATARGSALWPESCCCTWARIRRSTCSSSWCTTSASGGSTDPTWSLCRSVRQKINRLFSEPQHCSLQLLLESSQKNKTFSLCTNAEFNQIRNNLQFLQSILWFSKTIWMFKNMFLRLGITANLFRMHKLFKCILTFTTFTNYN